MTGRAAEMTEHGAIPARSLAMIAAGVVLLSIGALVSNSDIEHALLREPGSLAWGPTLFRALLVVHGVTLAIAGVLWGRQSRLERDSQHAFSGASDVPAMDWRWYAGLILLSAIGLGLRLWQLNSCLWFDEVVALLDFVRPPLGVIVTSFPNQNQHMLYSVLAHGSIRLFGESAAAVRLPAVLFGIGSIWALFLLGRRLSGARQSLLACALMTASYHHIWFSQNARGYTGLLFFTTLATWLWLVALSRGAWRWWMAYAVSVSLGMWLHMTMVFVVAAHVLVCLPPLLRSLTGGNPDQQWWKPVAAWLLCGTLTLQLYALALPEFWKTALHEVSLPTEWMNPRWAVREAIRGLRIGWSSTAVVLMGAALVAIGFAGIAIRQRRAAVAMLLPGVLGASTMLALGHNLWPRFFFFSMGFALLIVVHGAMTAPSLLPPPLNRFATGAGPAVVSLMILVSALTVPRCYALPKQDFIGAREYVEQFRREGEAVVSVGLAGRAYHDYFAPHWTVANTGTELEDIRTRHSGVWLVYTLPVELKAFHPELWDAVQRSFEVVKIFPGTLGGGELSISRERIAVSTRSERLPAHLAHATVKQTEKIKP